MFTLLQATNFGRLAMPSIQTQGQIAGLSWGEYPVNSTLIIILTFLAIFSLRTIASLVTPLADSMTNWRSHRHIEGSLQKTKSRNLTLLIVFSLSALFADWSRLFDISFLNDIPMMFRSLTTLGVMLVYLALKGLFFLLSSINCRKYSTLVSARQASLNYLLVLLVFCLVVGFIGYFFRIPVPSIRISVYVVAGLIYLHSLTGLFRILSSSFSTLIAFSYLCTLEIFPTAIFIAAACIL